MNEKLLPIVCDATLVLNLGHRGGLTVLTARLRDERELYVTPEVKHEVTRADPDYYLRFLEEHFQPAPVLEKEPPADDELNGGLLDPGELSVLALCRAKGWLAGIDEKEGRKTALALKIPLMGTIGVIEYAVKLQWMSGEEALEAMHRLRMGGFHCPKVLANDDFADYLFRLR